MSIDIGRLLDAAAAALPSGAEWAGVRRVRTDARQYAAKDGRFDAATEWSGDGMMIEVLFNGQFGYAATAEMTPAGAARAAGRALALASGASSRALYRFDREVRPGSALRYETPRVRKAAYGADLLTESAVKLTELMKISDKIVQTSTDFSVDDFTVELRSTSGASVEQTLHRVSVGYMCVARDGSVIQRRSGNGFRGRTMQGGWEFFDFEMLERDARAASEQAIELLSAPDCPVMKADLVLSPDQMMLQIHESVGHPCELDRILGDERNYAGSTFVKLEDIGSLRYGSDLMNITFDPTIPSELASYGADDIGNRAIKRHIVKDGILVAALGSLESQVRSGKPGVANQRAQSWNRPAIDRMANLNLEPGTESLNAIIASVEKGVYMQTNKSWSIDDYRNKFQFGCEYARLIENGKLGKTVRNPNYRGVSATFWRNLYKVGDRSTFQVFGTPNCGKGEPNQVITVGHASPTCAFKDVEIFGGAS